VIILKREGLLDFVSIFSDGVFRAVKGLGDEVVGLNVVNYKVQVVLRYFNGIKRVVFWHICHAIIHFMNGAQYARTVNFDLPILSAQPELYSKPIESSEFQELIIRATKRGHPNDLRKICDFLICKHRCVSKQLV